MGATQTFKTLLKVTHLVDEAAQAQITPTTSLDSMLSLAVAEVVTAQLPMVQLSLRHMVAVLCLVQGVEQAVGMERLAAHRLDKMVEPGVLMPQAVAERVRQEVLLPVTQRMVVIMRSVAVTAEEAAAAPLVVMLAGREEREAHQAEEEEREAALILGQVGLVEQAELAKSGFGRIR